tara:strand:- start:724 stop:1344 length:621 start_codon:yes stop_codon:yes gene_type:complete
MSKKLIITFEGIEGSGKSFHIKNVANFLKKKKIKFINIREPGGSKNSEKIRKLILNNKSNFNAKTDLLLYLASRSENIEKIIKKNYKKKIILIDRFVDSTLAYQHYAMGINKNIIKSMNSFLLEKIKVDFTFINQVNKHNFVSRLSKRKKLNRYDKFKINFYKKAQNGFLKISKTNRNKYMIINSNNSISYNKNVIIKKISSLIKI